MTQDEYATSYKTFPRINEHKIGLYQYTQTFNDERIEIDEHVLEYHIEDALCMMARKLLEDGAIKVDRGKRDGKYFISLSIATVRHGEGRDDWSDSLDAARREGYRLAVKRALECWNTFGSYYGNRPSAETLLQSITNMPEYLLEKNCGGAGKFGGYEVEWVSPHVGSRE